MARAGKGVSAITVWMIVFVGLWLASTVFLVILYTHQEELRKENLDLKKRYAQVISQPETQSIEQAKQAGLGEATTVVGALEAARAQTAEYATGERTDDVSSVGRKRNEILSRIQGGGSVSDPKTYADVSLYDALNRLHGEFEREHGSRTEGDKQIADLTTQVKNLVDSNSKERDSFAKKAEALSNQTKEAEQGREESRKQHGQQVAALEAQSKSHREQTDAELTMARQDRAKAERERTDIQGRLRQQTEKYAELSISPQELATARQADGRILTAVPGDDLVYIDLGAKDHLVLGMQFGVYPSEAGIPTDGRAKAQIEVVSIGTNSSECKVRRLSNGAVIIEGDIVANPVYDRQTQMKFVVVGDFDLDRDGLPDADGKATIESLVTRWGGVITDELDALTDFVVIGLKPRKPRPAADVPPAQTEVNAALQRQFDRYNDVISTAERLSIPTMNQNVFLNFLGYSDRMARR